jgi:hypothetical protein
MVLLGLRIIGFKAAMIQTGLYQRVQTTRRSQDHLKLQVIRPTNTDIQFALGSLEAILVRELWEAGTPLSVRELQTCSCEHGHGGSLARI